MVESPVITPGRGAGFDDQGLRTVTRLSPEDWLNAAQQRLIGGGIDAVKIGPLAEDMSVTRGSFYWHFRDRNHLLQALLARWQTQSHEMFHRLVGGDGATGMEEFVRLVHLWIGESDFHPPLEAAMRDWGRTSDEVAAVVQTVDEERIAYIKRIFLDFGYGEDEAFIRARVTYFHQVGLLHHRLQRIARRAHGAAADVRLRADRQVESGRDRELSLIDPERESGWMSGSSGRVPLP